MPHLVIEYARELEETVSPRHLIDRARSGAVDSALFLEEEIKLRTLAYDTYQVGHGENRFINVMVYILAGRTNEQKSHLTNAIAEQLGTLGLSAIELTVQVYDIEREAYKKVFL